MAYPKTGIKLTPAEAAKISAMMKDPYAGRRAEGGNLREASPYLYGALGGLSGTAPDEFEGSVLEPGSADIKRGAELTYPIGTAAQVVGGLPMKAGQIASAALRGAKNLATPAKLGKQAGVVKVGSGPKLPPEAMDVTGYHFSQQPRTSLSPKMFGTGLKGSARDEQLADPVLKEQVSFYIPKKGAVQPEAGVGGVAHESKLSGVYDADSDPLRLVGATRSETAKNLKEAGFKGMLNRMEGDQPGQVIMFGGEDIPTTALGPKSKLEGLTDLPAAKARPALGRDVFADQLRNDKTLPMGEAPPEMWGKILARKDPALHAELDAAGVFAPGKPVYKNDLAKAYVAATKAPDYVGAARGATAGERTVLAPKQVALAKRYLTGESKGKFRGTEAFGGISPQRMVGMEKGYKEKMAEGVDSRYWYDKASKAVHDWTGGNPQKSDTMANFLAETSAGTPVGDNLMYANKAWNQGLLGEDIKSGRFPNVMGKNMTQMLRNPEEAVQGLKRSPFSAGLSVNWRGTEFANRPTHDIHDVRAWGISDPKTGKLWDKGVPDAGHRFLDERMAKVVAEANKEKLGGAEDWNPYRAQAAAWISQKAKTDKSTLAAASRDYADLAPNYQAQITREWAPGTNTGHFPEYHNLPDEAKQEYARMLEQNVAGRAGIDKLSSDAGALVGPTHPNVGSYEGATEPGFITPVNVGKETGGQAMDAASQQVVDALAASHGILGMQKQVANNFLGTALKEGKTGRVNFPGEMSAVRMPGDYVPDDQMKALAEQMRAIDPNIVPQRDVRGGTRALMFGDKDRQNEMAQQLRGLGGEGTSFHSASGNLIPFNAPDQWSAKPFVEAIEASGPEFTAKVSEAMRGPAAGVLQASMELAQKYGMTEAPFFKTMLQGIAEGGIPRLKELIASGAVPAVFMALIQNDEPALSEGAV